MTPHATRSRITIRLEYTQEVYIQAIDADDAIALVAPEWDTGLAIVPSEMGEVGPRHRAADQHLDRRRRREERVTVANTTGLYGMRCPQCGAEVDRQYLSHYRRSAWEGVAPTDLSTPGTERIAD